MFFNVVKMYNKYLISTFLSTKIYVINCDTRFCQIGVMLKNKQTNQRVCHGPWIPRGKRERQLRRTEDSTVLGPNHLLSLPMRKDCLHVCFVMRNLPVRPDILKHELHNPNTAPALQMRACSPASRLKLHLTCPMLRSCPVMSENRSHIKRVRTQSRHIFSNKVAFL